MNAFARAYVWLLTILMTFYIIGKKSVRRPRVCVYFNYFIKFLIKIIIGPFYIMMTHTHTHTHAHT